MKQIADGVYIEDSYPGLMVAAVVRSKGAVLIDSPVFIEDGRAWLTALRGKGVGSERLLVNLDSQEDRTLGNRGVDAPVIAHFDVARIMRERPAIFKAQNQETGADWELLTGLSGTRWVAPSIVFEGHLQLRIGPNPVMVNAHPGPQIGAAWVELPEDEIVFIGDAVMVKEPPFLAQANLTAWIETLDELLSDKYKNYTILTSRCGEVKEKQIKEFKKFLQEVDKQLNRLAKRNSLPEDTEKLVDKLFTASGGVKKYKKQYSARLRYGLYHYYINQFINQPEKEV